VTYQPRRACAPSAAYVCSAPPRAARRPGVVSLDNLVRPRQHRLRDGQAKARGARCEAWPAWRNAAGGRPRSRRAAPRSRVGGGARADPWRGRCRTAWPGTPTATATRGQRSGTCGRGPRAARPSRRLGSDRSLRKRVTSAAPISAGWRLPWKRMYRRSRSLGGDGLVGLGSRTAREMSGARGYPAYSLVWRAMVPRE
jgi:hypothetical protein